MVTVSLQPNDPRLGTFDAEGVIKTWPAVTFHEQPYERFNATIRRVDAQHFVVFGPMRDDPELVIAVGTDGGEG